MLKPNKRRRNTRPKRTILHHPPTMFIVTHAGYPHHDVLVGVSVTGMEVRRALEEETGGALSHADLEWLYEWDEGSCTALGRTIMLDIGATVLLLRNWDESHAWQARLAHESLHAVVMLMDHIGAEFTRQSEEVYAYALENLYVQILDELAKPPSKRARSL